jgi:hypothetical protein
MQPVGTEIRIAEVVVAPGWNGIGFMTEEGRTAFIPVEAGDIRSFETELSKILDWQPLGGRDSSEADIWLERTGHIHPPDHLVVISTGTPLLAVPEPGSPLKTTLPIGERLTLNIREESTAPSDWFPVISQSGKAGWVSTGLVYGPVYLNGARDIEITGLLPDRGKKPKNLDKLLIESINETALEIDIDKVASWPWEVKAAVYHHQVLIGMTREMTRLSLGQPSKVDEEGGLEVWRYDRPDGELKFIHFRDGRVVRIEGSES